MNMKSNGISNTADVLITNETRGSFENFKSNTCHKVKEMGEISFIKEQLCSKEIDTLIDKKWFAEGLYLLAMIDYLSRKNDIPLYGAYNKLRCCKLDRILYPLGIYTMYLVTNDTSVLTNSYENAIPEFKRFNIVESEVENVF